MLASLISTACYERQPTIFLCALCCKRSKNILLNQEDIEEFKKNPQFLLDWNYWNNKPYKVGQISIGLVNMGNDRWLLFTIGIITKLLDKPISHQNKKGNGRSGVQVEYNTFEKFEDLYGRVVVSYHNESQQMFRNAETLIDQLVIKEILPSIFTGFDFPGYDNVSLTYEQLKTIVDGDYPSYHNALRNQKAVYLQTDKATGKMYVGSATAKEMLLSRWRTYVNNGHGGNKDLIALVEEKGFDYIKENFQYTILENYNSKVDDEYVLKRESYWKEVFQSRKFGYNKN